MQMAALEKLEELIDEMEHPGWCFPVWTGVFHLQLG